MKYLLITLISISALAMNNTEAKIKMTKYLEALRSKNEKEIQQLVSKDFFKDLSKNNILKETFSKPQANTKKIDFDIKIKKAQNEKNVYFINIKDKSNKSFGHNWFRLKDGLIDGTRYFD